MIQAILALPLQHGQRRANVVRLVEQGPLQMYAFVFFQMLSSYTIPLRKHTEASTHTHRRLVLWETGAFGATKVEHAAHTSNQRIVNLAVQSRKGNQVGIHSQRTVLLDTRRNVPGSRAMVEDFFFFQGAFLLFVLGLCTMEVQVTRSLVKKPQVTVATTVM